jgi:hypothetical protein
MLLGVNGTYGFQLRITPIVNVSITEYQSNPLILKVEVDGPGFPLSGANLGYYLYRTDKKGNIELTTGTEQTDSAGVAYLNFTFDGAETYTIIAHAGLGGLEGFGYYIHQAFEKGTGLIPFIVDYKEGKVFIAHDWDVNGIGEPPEPNYFYTATFYVLTEEFEFQEWPLSANSTGIINYGAKKYVEITLPLAKPGFLLVNYYSGQDYGMSIMPWGVGSPLAASILFGGVPAGNVWVASDFRHVTVGQLSYQAKILCWSLKGYQTRTPSGWRW